MHSLSLFLEYAALLSIGILGIVGRNSTLAGISPNEQLYQQIKHFCMVDKRSLDQQRQCFLQFALGLKNNPSLKEQFLVSSLEKTAPQSLSDETQKLTAPLATPLEAHHAALALKIHDEEVQSKEDRALARQAETAVLREIKKLVRAGYLNEQDLEQLNHRIEIHYVRSCGKTKGSYHMLESHHHDRLFKNIVLHINLCNLPKYRNRLDQFVQQILIHEMAHYLYFFKDNQIKTFEQICRSSDQNRCQFHDFVSSYAMQSKEEDYAESFANWYLTREHRSRMIVDPEHHASPNTPTRLAKMQYFDTVYGK